MSSNQDSLIKFCSVACAGRILNQQELRWSAPNRFGDVLELKHDSQLEFTHAQMLEATIQMACSMIFAKDDPKGMSPLAKAIRRWRDEERFETPEEAEGVLKELLVQMVDTRYNEIQELVHDWREYARSVRICSFSAKPENMAAWSKYGLNHSGIALKFRSGYDEESNFNDPHRVAYKGLRPEVTSLKQQLGLIVTPSNDDLKDEFQDKLLHKAAHFKEEQEWRCFRYQETEKGSDPESWYEDVPFEPEDLGAVYFGAMIDPRVKDVILRLLQSRYRRARLYQAKLLPGKFELEFERIAPE